MNHPPAHITIHSFGLRQGSHMNEERALQPASQILIYQTEDGKIKIEARLQDETVWLTQKHMAELFQTTKQNIGQHLRNIFEEGELHENSVVKRFFTTAADGKNYRTSFYNLDAIISVGYRIKSHVATRFRQWATRHIKEFIIKGFVYDRLDLQTRWLFDFERPQHFGTCWENIPPDGQGIG